MRNLRSSRPYEINPRCSLIAVSPARLGQGLPARERLIARGGGGEAPTRIAASAFSLQSHHVLPRPASVKALSRDLLLGVQEVFRASATRPTGCEFRAWRLRSASSGRFSRSLALARPPGLRLAERLIAEGGGGVDGLPGRAAELTTH
jgi:hypothetical protein